MGEEHNRKNKQKWKRKNINKKRTETRGKKR